MKTLSVKSLKKETRTICAFGGRASNFGETTTTTGGGDTTTTTTSVITTTHLK